jgi:hypothetical protein
MPGAYEARYPEAAEQLTIRPDGSYSQVVKFPSRTNIFQATGKWRFDPRVPEVVFDKEFLVVLNGFGQISKDFPQHRTEPTVIPMEIARSITGRLRLGGDPGTVYVRKE